MAEEIIRKLVDDLDGSPAVVTVKLGWDGLWYRLDLNIKNSDALYKSLTKYLAAGSPVVEADDAPVAHKVAKTNGAAKKKAKNGNGKVRDFDPKAVRSWAMDQGITISDRGRIPTWVVEKYRVGV